MLKIEKTFEVIGMILILGSFLVGLEEISIENSVKEYTYSRTQIKLDSLFNIVYNQQKNQLSNENFDLVVLNDAYKNWQYYSESRKEIDDWKKVTWINFISWSKYILFILGSVCLILDKCKIIKNDPK